MTLSWHWLGNWASKMVSSSGPVRTALSGEPTSPGGAMELADILGKEESLRRIRKGIELLKG